MYTLHREFPPAPPTANQEHVVSKTVVHLAPARLCRIAAALAVSTAPVCVAAAQSTSLHEDSRRAAAGAPTPDSLARLGLGRFFCGTGVAFDSVYTDPLAGRVMRPAVGR